MKETYYVVEHCNGVWYAYVVTSFFKLLTFKSVIHKDGNVNSHILNPQEFSSEEGALVAIKRHKERVNKTTPNFKRRVE